MKTSAHTCMFTCKIYVALQYNLQLHLYLQICLYKKYRFIRLLKNVWGTKMLMKLIKSPNIYEKWGNWLCEGDLVGGKLHCNA